MIYENVPYDIVHYSDKSTCAMGGDSNSNSRKLAAPYLGLLVG